MSRRFKDLDPIPSPNSKSKTCKTTRRISNSNSGRIRSRALQIRFGDAPIRWLSKDVVEVPSETVGGRYYVVNLLRETCGCGWWRKRKTACKHIVAACEERMQLTGERPPGANRSVYRNPRYYDRLRRVRKSCLQEMLRCIREWVSHG